MTDSPAEISDLFSARPWLDCRAALPAEVRAVPAMLREEEELFYFWLARDWARGAGEILDIGCFAGGSTARLAAGLAVSGRSGLIHAFDRFTVSAEAKQRHLYPAGVPRFSGDDLLPVARALLAPWETMVTFYRGDLLRQHWSEDPVELLVLDASKTDQLADHCAALFFPHLIPGRSVVVQQDHLHDAQPWLPAQMELLADCFLPLSHCGRDGVSFLCTARPTPGQLRQAAVTGLPDATLSSLLAQAGERLAPFCGPKSTAGQISALGLAPGERRSWAVSERLRQLRGL